MKLNVAITGLVLAVVIGGAYYLGLQDGRKNQDEVADVALNFSHFRVGNRNVKAMLADGPMVWVGTSGGIIRYDIQADDYSLFDVKQGNLLSNGVFHLSKWGKHIYVGTYGGGLSTYSLENKKWQNYNIPHGLADQFVYEVEQDEKGDLWIATWSGVNQVKNGDLHIKENWVTYNKENTQGGIPNDWIYALEIAKDGTLWLATEQGLARLKDQKWTNWQHEHGLGAKYELVKDDIQFSHDPSSASKHHARQKQEQGLGRVKVAYNPNYVVSLKVDKDGIVWCGTWGGGLARFDGKSWQNFTMKNGLPSNHIFTLYIDEKQSLWAGTSHGLARFDAKYGNFTVYSKKDGLYADNVFSLSKSQDGSMWVGSFGGVSRIAGMSQ